MKQTWQKFMLEWMSDVDEQMTQTGYVVMITQTPAFIWWYVKSNSVKLFFYHTNKNRAERRGSDI